MDGSRDWSIRLTTLLLVQDFFNQASTLTASLALTFRVGLVLRLGLEHRPVAVVFIVLHCHEPTNNHDPVNVVRYDCSVGCRVGPAEQSIKNTPSPSTIEFWTAAVDVPDRSSNVVRSWSRTECVGIAT